MSKKDAIKKRHNNMVSLLLVVLAASNLFLSVAYAAMTSSLKVTGNGTVKVLEYDPVYYNGSGFFTDDACTTAAKDKAGSNITKLSTMVSLMKNDGKIFIKQQYATTVSETITANNNVYIERYTGTKNGPYKGHLISVSGSTNTCTMSTSSTGHIILEGNKATVSNIEGHLLYVYGGTFQTQGKVTFQNNDCLATSKNAGAVYVEAYGKFYTLENSIVNFYNNKALRGGAIGLSYLSVPGYMNLSGTVNFTENQAVTGGAVYVDFNSVANLYGKITFSKNKTTSFLSGYTGGAIRTAGTTNISGSVTFSENQSYNGGAIHSSAGSLTLSGSISIKNNSAQGGYGGGLYLSPGAQEVYIECKKSGTSATKSGSVSFYQNSSSAGTEAAANLSCSNSTGVKIWIPFLFENFGGELDLTRATVTRIM